MMGRRLLVGGGYSTGKPLNTLVNGGRSAWANSCAPVGAQSFAESFNL